MKIEGLLIGVLTAFYFSRKKAQYSKKDFIDKDSTYSKVQVKSKLPLDCEPKLPEFSVYYINH